jgi:hypothetical protein
MKSIKDLIQEDIQEYDCILAVYKPVQMIEVLAYSAQEDGEPQLSITKTIDTRLVVCEDTHEFIFDDPIYASSVVEAIANNQYKDERFFVKSDLNNSISYVKSGYAGGSVVRKLEIAPLVKLEKLCSEFALKNIFSIPLEALNDVDFYFRRRCHLKSFERQISEYHNSVTVDFVRAERTYSFFGDNLILSM